MSFLKYTLYQSVPNNWFERIPKTWEALPLRRIARQVSDKAETASNPIALENIQSWTGRYIESETDFQGNGIAFNTGDLLFGKLRPYLAKAYLADSPGEAVGDFHVLRLSKEILGRYFRYQILSSEFISVVNSSSYGSKMPRASWEDMAILKIAIPSLSEQKSIADFLDRETTKIDTLVAEQEKLIALLQEKRQALISHAVTKGLDSKAPMKDSGVEWLGKIPKHWEVQRGRFLYKKRESAPFPDDGVVTAFRDGQVTLRENRRTDGFTLAVLEVGYQRVLEGDLVIHGMDAFAGAIGVSDSIGKCTPEYVVLEPAHSDTNNYYFSEILRIMAKRNFIYVLCPSVRERAPRFRFEKFKEVLLPVPPPREQSHIVEHIRSANGSIDPLLQESRKAIELLKERRAALITAAVTGKIDVRGLA